MADIKVRDLTDTTNIDLQNQIMVLTNDENNQVQNITVENLLSNVLSSDNGNVLEQGTDGKLYVETPENITGDLADLSTINKTSLVNAINEVDSDITDEATTRSNADNNLQSQIDAITSASDVTDIVGTYAQLQAYDTTGLPDNSIIKVLQDESRQNETTYYRWVITGGVGAWVLIGEEGPYYTKSQADSLFATQQTTGNLASLDTSDKTSLVNAINELSSVLDPTQTADYINNSKAVESGSVSSNSIILSNVIKYAHSSFDRSKFTVVGSPVITDDGIASEFSRTSYIKGDSIDLTNAKTLVIKGKFTINGTVDNGNRHQCILHLSKQNIGNNDPIKILVSQDSQQVGLCYPNSATTNSKVGFTSIIWGNQNDFIIEANATTMKFTLNGTEVSNVSVDSTWWKQIREIWFGNSANDAQWEYINGFIDLKQFSITVDGVEVFSGNKTGIDTIKPDNYTVVGTPKITADGVASELSPNNRLEIPFNSTGKTNFKIKVPFRFSNTMTLGGSIVWGNAGIGTYCYGTKSYTPSLLGTQVTAFAGSEDLQVGIDYILEVGIENSTNCFFKITRFDTNVVVAEKTWTTERTSEITTLYISQLNDISIDLNSFKIYVDGNLVYQPCLKIPYTLSKTGSKIVNAIYRDRVNDMASQFGYANYYTLDEDNGNFTLPMGELYGMIERLNQLAKDEIGLPKATFSNTLNDNEIWLEGAEVSKLTYSKLYAIYGDDYGTPTDSTNFVLPDFRDKVMQGIGSGGSFGYIEAGLPNIKGKQNEVRRDGDPNNNGALHSIHTRTGISSGTGGGQAADIYFDASWSNSIYGNSTTVQPPAIKVRFKTRFQ